MEEMEQEELALPRRNAPMEGKDREVQPESLVIRLESYMLAAAQDQEVRPVELVAEEIVLQMVLPTLAEVVAVAGIKPIMGIITAVLVVAE